ncbi:MAG TPA: helix-turn-helix domain-containing protein [archaeon]|nr:helix-turn-helix domain-containing protein [archaeon]
MDDPDVNLVWDFLKHIFPEYSIRHAQVYKLLWRLEPKSGDSIESETGLCRATVYKILHELIVDGLVMRTGVKPVGYYAADPVKAYASHTKKLVAKLEDGKERIERLVHNSSGLSGELYLVKRDGGQQRLIIKKGRAGADTEQLIQLKRVVEEQIQEAGRQKAKAWVVYH